MIKLDEKWSIVPDTYSWCLQQEVEKTRKKDGKEEQYTVVEKWYYPTIQNCLKKYTDEATKECKDMQEVLEKLHEIKNTVERVKKIYVKEGNLVQTD